MRIGELFISLGFQIQGQKDFDDAERGLTRAAVNAGKLTIAVNAVNWAMLAMVDSAMKVAVSLRLFEQTTGGSTDDLQQWGQAAKVAGISAESLKTAVMSLNDARNAFAMGEPQNVGAWSVLGIDPREDPFKVLEHLRARLGEFKDKNLMRGLLGKVGMEGIMPVLQMPADEFKAFRKNLVVSPTEIDRLVRLNREWQKLQIALAAAKNQLAAALAPSLERFAKILKWVVEGIVSFTEWLNSSSDGAIAARFTLGLLAVALLGIGAGLASITAGMGLLVASFRLLSPTLIAVGAAAAPFLALLTAVIGGIVLFHEMMDDLVTFAQGGESLFDWSATVAGINLVGDAFDWVCDRVQWLIDHNPFAGFGGLPTGIKSLLKGSEGGLASNQFTNGFGSLLNGVEGALPKLGGAGGKWSQENNVTVMIDGSRSPEATASAVGSTVGDELTEAFYQGLAREF